MKIISALLSIAIAGFLVFLVDNILFSFEYYPQSFEDGDEIWSVVVCGLFSGLSLSFAEILSRNQNQLCNLTGNLFTSFIALTLFPLIPALISALFFGFVGQLSVLLVFQFFTFILLCLGNIKSAKTLKEKREHRKAEKEAEKLAQLKEAEMDIRSNIEVSNFLAATPDYTQSQLLLEFHPITREALEQIATETFEEMLKIRDFDKAETLAKFHPIDQHNLVYVQRKLNDAHMDGQLPLEPNTFKIIMDDDETAFEKLPCNWQKIHTYLAPLEDELEQADILDSGNIYITDKRVFFVGQKGSETVKLSDIAFIDHKEDALQFFRDKGLSEIFAFPTQHHATFAKMVIDELLRKI